MNSTAILELFFGLLPIEIVGLLLLRFSYSLKKKEKSKFANATKALLVVLELKKKEVMMIILRKTLIF